MNGSIRRWLFVVLVIAGGFLRLYRLDKYPLGVHQDELSNIYDGWSLATTGHDRFGDRYPAVVRAFGERDYRPAMYAWMAAVPLRLTGFSIVSGRLPAAIFGIACLFLVYAFAREMAGNTFAMLSLLLVTLSPLHIQFSRLAHEGAILPAFFMILALFLWHRAARREFPLLTLAALGLVLGLSTNVYQSSRVTGALMTLAIAIDIIVHAKDRARRLALLGGCALAGALPQILFLIDEPARFAGRASVLSVTADNPVTYIATVIKNFSLNLAPWYLFYPPYLRGLTVTRLLPVELPFFYLGLVALAFIPVREKSRGRAYIYAAMFVTILMSGITLHPPSTMRTSPISVLAPFFTAAGIVFAGRFVRDEAKRRRVYYPAIAASIVLTSLVVTYRYSRSEYFRELSFQELGVRMGKALRSLSADYDAVIIGPDVSQAYLYIAAFTEITPTEFHRMPRRLYSVGMDRYTRMGKYHFVTESTMQKTIPALRGKRVLFVLPRKVAGLTAVDSVRFRESSLYFETW